MGGQNNNKNQLTRNKILNWLRFGGEFANQAEEEYFQKSNWKNISINTRYVMTIGIVVLGLFSFLEWVSAAPTDEKTIILTASLPLIAFSFLIVFLYKFEKFHKYAGVLILLLAVFNALANAYILFSEFAVWNFYLIVVLGQILFFSVFVPNRFKYTLASVVVLAGGYIYVGHVLVGDVLLTESAIISIAVAAASLYYKYYLNQQIRRFYEDEKKLERRLQDADFTRDLYEKNAEENINLMEQLAIAEGEAKQNSQFLTAVLDHIHQGIIVYDKNYKLVAWNTPLEGLLDFPEGFLRVGMEQEEILVFNAKRGEYGEGDPDELVRSKIKSIQLSKSSDNFIYDRRRPDGRIMNVIGTSLPDGGIISSYTDVTIEREREEETRLKSLRDSLTQLSNRRAFEADINSAQKQSSSGEKPFVLAMIDLDNFKPINDTYGHPVGDEVLRQVADILRSHIRGTDSASRIGGDEFAIIFRNVNDIDLINERVTSIIRAIAKITIEGCDEMKLGASAGIAQHLIHAETIDQLMHISDQALYAAKEAGKNTVIIGNPS